MADQPEALERLEAELLGGSRKYTRSEVAERSGVPMARAERLWRSLGFASTSDDEVVFGDADVDALKAIDSIVEQGIVKPESENSVARSLGQVMARLADWQTSLMSGLGDGDDGPHVGIQALHRVLDRLQPTWHLHGHIHPYGQTMPDRHVGPTTIRNVIPWKVLDVTPKVSPVAAKSA